MVEWLTQQRTITLRNRGAAEGAFEAHARIFEAVAAHDADRAEREMREHLGEVARLYWLRMGKDERDGRLRHTG
jgi:DNA-binding FadR family transcriptional regulator